MAGFRRFLLRLASFFRSQRVEADLAREIDAHLQLLEDTFLARGMAAADARAAARRAFGGVDQAKEQQRDARSFRWVDNWWLDAKLGVRLLIRFPGLTFVGGLGMAVAVAIAAGAFVIIGAITNPVLPVHDGHRVVTVQNFDAAARTVDRHLLHDFVTWRDGVDSIVELGAFRNVARNLIAPGGQPETVRVAEMSATGFRIAGVAPLLGRHLLDADERDGAPNVVVIGCDLWRTRFGADPDIVGRTLHLGPTTHAIVGVMPEGFGFPVNYSLWVPLRLRASAIARRAGPEIRVFGRLAPGATLEAAQAELTTVGRRMAATFPDSHAQLRAQVLPYAYTFFDVDDPMTAAGQVFHFVRLLMALLIAVVAVNVAILVYARTARRRGEIALRSALGATRRRIVLQFFMEALVLAAAAAGLGLGAAALAMRQVNAVLSQLYAQLFSQLPFWWRFGLSPGAVVYVLALTLLAATIVGVVPALKATGRRVQSGLRHSGTGRSGMKLGGTWSVLIVAQVGAAVALLPGAVFLAWDSLRLGLANPGIVATEVLTAELRMDRETSPAAAVPDTERAFAAHNGWTQAELVRRLEGEPVVAGVTLALALPGEEPTVWIEVEGVPTPPESEAEASNYAVRSGRFGHEVRFGRVSPGFFEAFGVPILAGRILHAGDVGPAASVVVNRTLAQHIGGENILGRRVRYVGRSGGARPEDVELGRWYEIVGVVDDFPRHSPSMGLVHAKLYHAAAPGQLYPASLAVRLRGTTPAAFASRLREIAAAVDPNLQLRQVASMDARLRQEQSLMQLVAAVLVAITVSVLLLSAAGIYALMSFTVAERRKEIGIRAALGADPRRILWGIFSRALGQLAVGAVLGGGVALLVETLSHGELMKGNAALVLPVVAVFMTAVGLLAAFGPARRGLRIQPTEALRDE